MEGGPVCWGRLPNDHDGASQSETTRALLTSDEVMNIREDELLVKMPQKPAARLTQRRYDDDPKVRGRATARGESWIPPLGLERVDGPLEVPEFDDALDDDEPDGPEGDASGRAPAGGQGDDEATAGDSIMPEEPDPFRDDFILGACRARPLRGAQGHKGRTGAGGAPRSLTLCRSYGTLAFHTA